MCYRRSGEISTRCGRGKVRKRYESEEWAKPFNLKSEGREYVRVKVYEKR